MRNRAVDADDEIDGIDGRRGVGKIFKRRRQIFDNRAVTQCSDVPGRGSDLQTYELDMRHLQKRCKVLKRNRAVAVVPVRRFASPCKTDL